MASQLSNLYIADHRLRIPHLRVDFNANRHQHGSVIILISQMHYRLGMHTLDLPQSHAVVYIVKHYSLIFGAGCDALRVVDFNTVGDLIFVQVLVGFVFAFVS